MAAEFKWPTAFAAEFESHAVAVEFKSQRVAELKLQAVVVDFK